MSVFVRRKNQNAPQILTKTLRPVKPKLQRTAGPKRFRRTRHPIRRPDKLQVFILQQQSDLRYTILSGKIPRERPLEAA